MSKSPPTNLSLRLKSHYQETNREESDALGLQDPSQQVSTKVGKCISCKRKHASFCAPLSNKKMYCKACKPNNSFVSYRSVIQPVNDLSTNGFCMIDLPSNCNIPIDLFHNLLYDRDGQIAITKEGSKWTHIFNNSFDESKATYRYMKKIGNYQHEAVKLTSIITAILNKLIPTSTKKSNKKKEEDESFFIPSDICFLLRGEQLNSPQIWHRDEKKETNSLFMIIPFSKSYHIYVIPKSHTLDDNKDVSSKDFEMHELNPGQMFIGAGNLVHAGGNVNKFSTSPRIIHDYKDKRSRTGTKCYDIALHAYITKGFHSTPGKSEETVKVEVVDGLGNAQTKPPYRGSNNGGGKRKRRS